MSTKVTGDAALGTAKAPPLVARTLNKLTAPNSAPAPILKAHRWLYERTAGRLGPGMIGAWTLLLRTTGRRTGARRTTALVFARDGQRFVLAASNDGKAEAPAWLLNVRSNPAVELQVGRSRFLGRAAVLGRSDPDYPRLWELMNATNNRRYDFYQAKTSRPIPVVVVTPADARER
jgi:deazaflavin-dependent oxidoreductase (nitroreductase family)